MDVTIFINLAGKDRILFFFFQKTSKYTRYRGYAPSRLSRLIIKTVWSEVSLREDGIKLSTSAKKNNIILLLYNYNR